MNKICTFILGSKTKLNNLKCFQFTLHFLNIYLLAKMHTAANRPKKPEWRLQCGASRRPPPPALTQVEFTGPLRGKGTYCSSNVALVRILIFVWDHIGLRCLIYNNSNLNWRNILVTAIPENNLIWVFLCLKGWFSQIGNF